MTADRWGQAEGLLLVELSRGVQMDTRRLRGTAFPSRIDTINGFVMRSRRQMLATFHLLDGGFPEDAATLSRGLLDLAVTLVWLRQDWDHRFWRWAFDDVSRAVEWFEGVVSGAGSAWSGEDKAELESRLTMVRETAKLARQRGQKRMPQAVQMFEELQLEGVHRQWYSVLSQAFAHATPSSMNPDLPSLDWAFPVAHPYSAAASSLWAILMQAEEERSRGWRPKLEELRKRLSLAERRTGGAA